MLVVVQSHLPVIQKMQMAVEVPQVQFIDKVTMSKCRDRHSPSTKLSMCQRCSKHLSLWSSTS